MEVQCELTKRTQMAGNDWSKRTRLSHREVDAESFLDNDTQRELPSQWPKIQTYHTSELFGD